jgi:uncharacterized membrane protein YczE
MNFGRELLKLFVAGLIFGVALGIFNLVLGNEFSLTYYVIVIFIFVLIYGIGTALYQKRKRKS